MNYKIIGSDQKEYGPVSLEQLRQWLNEGRLNTQSLAQREGETEWKPLAAFPEVTGPVAPMATPGVLTPAPTPAPFSSAPASFPAPGGPDAERKVRTPAILLIVVAGLGVVGALIGLAQGFLGVNMFNMGNLPPDMPPEVAKWVSFSMKLGPVSSLLGLLLNIVILFGGLSMLKLQRWGLAMAACIIALVCGNPCCCPIGLVAGIWGLVVLVNAEVKSAFH